MIPFLLIPEALHARGALIGGRQSSIWVWHAWHALFPAIVALALIVDERAGEHPIPRRAIPPCIAAVMGAVTAAVLVVTVLVTTFHAHLPELIDAHRVPVRYNFYWVGGFAAGVTAIAFGLAARRAQRRAVLHLWLALVLLAFLADEAASLGGYPRYALGWYFGRIESMLATGTLLAVFLTDINRLYYRLERTIREVHSANRKLSETIVEKDALLAELRESEERERRMAYQDAITDLPNRRWLMDTLKHTLAQARRHGHTTAVLFVDLDRFREVNDTLGHDVGDGLLREVALRLRGCVRAGDTVSRLRRRRVRRRASRDLRFPGRDRGRRQDPARPLRPHDDRTPPDPDQREHRDRDRQPRALAGSARAGASRGRGDVCGEERGTQSNGTECVIVW